MAKQKDIPAVIKDIPMKDIMEIALIENLQREDLNCIEEALAYRGLIEHYSVTQEEISEAVGKSRPHITNTLRLLNLGEEVIEMIERGYLTAGHGKALLRVTNLEAQLTLANKVVEEELSVRITENLAKRISESSTEEVIKKEKEKDIFIVDVEEKLRNIFGTKVNISKGKKKGKIEIEYYNDDDLNNIVSMLLEEA
jgi:ParB family chromosome partitioning protein